ncbi:AMP-binding enzyme [Streptomyces sp. NBC_01465]|uniref:AMP-binding enzyme n=1 Tax=Streptomyces sp. NBC_01465 TaxID=2903878 RepID=UPI002E37A4F0|nr:phosphopantetheine-binding protein [Streptomyces sp. NBC_01465]
MEKRTVTVRGFDVEPAEIERALEAWPLCAEAAVLPRRSADGPPVLAGYVVLTQQPAPSSWAAELAAFLREMLPAHMIPTACFAVERLPRTASGEIDAAALPVPDVPENSVSAPEALLAGVVTQLIGHLRAPLGPDDDYFLLGLDSVGVIQILALVDVWTGHEVDIAQMFEISTVRQLREFLDSFAPDWFRAAAELNPQGALR